jgi:hypothetical protein
MRNPLRWIVLLASVFLLLLAGHTTAAQRAQKSAKREASSQITLRPGAVISVRVADTVNSSHNHAGDLITGAVDPSVLINNRVVIPRGTEAHLRLMEDKKGGRIHGKAAIRLELVALVLNQEKQDVDSDDYGKKEGALEAKAKGEALAGASGGIRAAASANPVVGAADPIIAIFRPAKVEIPAGTRIPFTLTTPFTFDRPKATEPSGSDTVDTRAKAGQR